MNVSSVGRHIENLQRNATDDDGASSGYLTVEQVRGFRSVFCFLNGKDRDILYLIFVSKKRQKDVQQILRRGQPSLCYDIKRIRRRLKFIFYLNSVFDIFMDFVQYRSSEFSKDEMDILTLMFYTSSFTQTSETLKVSQVRVRYAFDKCVHHLASMKMWDVYEIFAAIRGNLNVVKRRYKGDGPVMTGIFFPV